MLAVVKSLRREGKEAEVFRRFPKRTLRSGRMPPGAAWTPPAFVSGLIALVLTCVDTDPGYHSLGRCYASYGTFLVFRVAERHIASKTGRQ
jgi:hypothetical protein